MRLIKSTKPHLRKGETTGVYRCGFATNSAEGLRRGDPTLVRQPSTCSSNGSPISLTWVRQAGITEADWRLFTHLVRLIGFRSNVGISMQPARASSDYPNLLGYVR